MLPESTDELLMLRPVGGLDEEVTGVLPAVEAVAPATFRLPGREDLGDFASGRLLRDAARLSTRTAAGPFRSFGRIAVEPRPYQLVPLMMALELDPVRLLVADDVGIGKTVEACLIARELLDRGEVRRLAVLCPPHLAEQWQRELAEKFHLEAELVLSSTIQRLERDLPLGVSVFERHPVTVVSTDFIKAARRAEDFALKCPELVIVDEAHGCTLAGGSRSDRGATGRTGSTGGTTGRTGSDRRGQRGQRSRRGRQQRHDLLRRLAADPERHLVLVTATPHSGNEEAFRSLLGLLEDGFADLPADLDRAEREGVRRRLARHLVQRRRGDVRRYLETDTAFPERRDKEATYTFSPAYRTLFDDVLAFAREYVSEDGGGRRRQRVRYWSALALLRCVSSSPAAAVATLCSRAAADQAEDEEDVDEVGRRSVLDQGDDDDTVPLDLSPGSDTEGGRPATRRKLLELARRAGAVAPEEDRKLQGAVREVKAFLKDGFRPVVFCRFVDTADYVARHLRGALPEQVRVESVTGRLPPAEREARIDSLAAGGGRFVLVCTDCLSEGINLQEHFDAVLHYDLAWNPTRHEQREGRVDRFGQERREVRAVTYYGADNPIDGVILDVLIRKHKSIKSDLGVAVAVPGSGEQIAEALFEGALFREQAGAGRHQLALDFIDDLDAQTRTIHAGWENARDREKASRSRFAQHTLKPEAVAAELEQVRAAIGRSEDVARFFTAVLRAANVPVRADAIDGKTGGKIGTADKTGTSGKTVAQASAGARSRTRTHAAAGAADAVGADSPADTDRAADAAGAVGANGAADTASAAGTDRAADAADPARHGKPNHDGPDRSKPGHGRITVQVSPETPRALRQAIGQEEPFTGRFDLPLPEGEIHLGRTSPVVEGLASWTLDQALDRESRDDTGPVASRCGATATSAVSERTTLLVARFRYHLVRRRSGAGGRGPGGGGGSIRFRSRTRRGWRRYRFRSRIRREHRTRRRRRRHHPVRGDRPPRLHRPGGGAALALLRGGRTPAGRRTRTQPAAHRRRTATRPAAPGSARVPGRPRIRRERARGSPARRARTGAGGFPSESRTGSKPEPEPHRRRTRAARGRPGRLGPAAGPPAGAALSRTDPDRTANGLRTFRHRGGWGSRPRRYNRVSRHTAHPAAPDNAPTVVSSMHFDPKPPSGDCAP